MTWDCHLGSSSAKLVAAPGPLAKESNRCAVIYYHHSSGWHSGYLRHHIRHWQQRSAISVQPRPTNICCSTLQLNAIYDISSLSRQPQMVQTLLQRSGVPGRSLVATVIVWMTLLQISWTAPARAIGLDPGTFMLGARCAQRVSYVYLHHPTQRSHWHEKQPEPLRGALQASHNK